MTELLNDNVLVEQLNNVDVVVSDSNKFKLKLGIGEDVYSSLKLTKTLQSLWDVKGAAGAAGAGGAPGAPVSSTRGSESY